MKKDKLLKVKISAENLLNKLEKDSDKNSPFKINKLIKFIQEVDKIIVTLSKEVNTKETINLENILNKEFKNYTKEITKAIKGIKLESPKIMIPQAKVIKNDSSKLEGLVRDLIIAVKKQEPADFKQDNSDIIKAIKSIKVGKTKIEFPEHISIDNFPVQLTPQPVTNININGLRGPIKSSAKEIGGSAALLPDEPLENRRTIVLYNNSSGTLWIGGSTVTSATGLPVFGNSYSNPFDLSDRVSLYGISGSGSLDIRIFEASMDEIGA